MRGAHKLMMQVTNNAKNFFEKHTSPIYIYGCGNYGKWIASYMQRCHMEFEGFIDKKVSMPNCFLYGKKIIHPDALPALGQTKIRIIIATLKSNEILEKLSWYTENINMLCMLPLYKEPISDTMKYDINKFLSFFRAKLIPEEIPTIFSDRCTAGIIYRALGKNMISPTINTEISKEDFLKICKNPRYYFEEDMVFGYWTICQFGTKFVGKIKDVEVLFGHTEDVSQAISRWNKMRKWINWDNIIYIMTDGRSMIPYQLAKEFCSLKDKHLLLMENNLYISRELQGGMFVNHKHFHDRNTVIEDWFDLVGWINGEFEI